MAAQRGLSVAQAGLPMHVACCVMPMNAGEPCGDLATCHAWQGPDGAACQLLVIVDGLGHGPEAARAADAAARVIAAAPDRPLPALLAALDACLASTRGAAVGLMRIDGGHARHAGIGNTRAMRLRGDSLTRLPSENGIVGGGLARPVQVNEIDVESGDWLLLFTDGIDERLQLPMRLPEWEREPATLCDHLLAHWRNVRDDAGVLVARMAKAAPVPFAADAVSTG